MEDENSEIETGIFAGGVGTSREWLKRIEIVQLASQVFICAEVLADNPNSVTPSTTDKSIEPDLTRMDLIFVVFRRYFEIKKDRDLKDYQQFDELFNSVVEKAALAELIQMGKLLSNNEDLLPKDFIYKLYRRIFEKLSKFERIKEISDQIALRLAGMGDW